MTLQDAFLDVVDSGVWPLVMVDTMKHPRNPAKQKRSWRRFEENRRMTLYVRGLYWPLHGVDETVCAICNGEKGPIDWDAPRYHPLRGTIDHRLSRANVGDEAAHVPENIDPAHRACNLEKR